MKRLLVIGYVWPEPDSSAAGKRMLQLLDFFLKLDYKITFSTTTSRTAYAADLESLGIETQKIRLNDPGFDEFIQKLDPALVLFDRFMMEEQFGWRVTETCPAAMKILDTEDLHFLRKAREMSLKKGIPVEELLLTSDEAKREIASIYRCDLSLIISEAEMNLLQNTFRIDNSLLLYLPFLLPKISEEEVAAFPNFDERQHFVSIGTFLHEPNWNQVLYLKERIWPLIRKELPQAEMHIYGSYPSQKVYNLHQPASGFLVRGRAENAEEVMRTSRLCLAPLLFGAGLKGKLIQAMQCGTPSITTAVGAEGIPGELPWNGAIEDEPADFARAAIELYQNETLWKEKQQNGTRIINTRFSSPQLEKEFRSRIEALEKDLQLHRRKNFTGAMLQHHHHRSTYFMSKYIELKNRK